jgi:hypothetical protein
MDDPRAAADARLEEAIAAAGVADPRPACRERLKALRQSDSTAFDRALEYFDRTLVSAIADGAEPLAQWVAYGRFLGELGGRGRTVAVDGSGRARAYEESAPPAGALVLFIPDETHKPAVPLLVPAAPTPAQRATIDLLVRGRREP